MHVILLGIGAGFLFGLRVYGYVARELWREVTGL